MDATIKKIVKLLDDERIERRCAAAMILAELRVKDAEAVEALGRCLTDGNHLLQGYALEALAGVRSPKIAGHLTLLLDSPEQGIRTRATALLAQQGSRVLTSLFRELPGAPVTRQRAIISLLAQSPEEAIFDHLLELLPDGELGEYVLNSLRGRVEQMSPAEVETLRQLLAARLKKKTFLADSVGAGRALRLLGYMRNPKLVRLILPFATEKHPLPLRLAALAALRRPLQAATTADEAVGPLLACADDPDPTLARAALDTLRGLKLAPAATEPLMRLAEGRHAEARTFALEALGRSSSQKVVKSLLGHLAGTDPAAREAAVRSLRRLDGAALALAKELEGALADPERLRTLCRLIRGQAELPPAARKTITALARQAIEGGAAAGAAEVLLDLLVAVDGEGYKELLLERAGALRKAKRHEEAFALLGKIDAAGLLDDDARYAALVSGLCALPSKKELGRASRTTDPILRLLVDLLARGNNVATRLKREKSLTADDLFYIGFNFSESKDEDEKEFGGELLAHLARSSPRSKLGRSAKNKLHLMGLDL